MARDRDDYDERHEDRHGRGHGRDDEESNRRGRDDDDRRGRDRDRDDDRGSSRSRGRGDDDERGSRRGRDDDDGDKKRKGNPKLEVRLERVRLSYPALFRPKSYDNDDDKGNAKYSASFIIDPTTAHGKKAIADCEDAIDEAKFEKWGNKQPRLNDDKIALRDDKGDNTDNPEYEGMMYVSASNSKRPKVFDRLREPLTDEDGVIYGGCYVNAIVRFWAQDNKYGKRVNASLEGVQFVKDGEAFGAAPLSDDAFDIIDDDEDGDSRGRGRDGRDRDRGRDDDRGSRDRAGGRIRDRGRDDDRGSRDRGRDRDDDRPSRSRDRDRDDDRGRDDDRSRSRDRGDRDRDDDRGGRGRSSRDLV